VGHRHGPGGAGRAAGPGTRPFPQGETGRAGGKGVSYCPARTEDGVLPRGSDPAGAGAPLGRPHRGAPREAAHPGDAGGRHTQAGPAGAGAGLPGLSGTGLSGGRLRQGQPGGGPGPAGSFGKAPMEETDIKFGYCTEFIILTGREFSDQEEQEFKAYLESIGDSIVCVADDEVVKVHVHTNDPGLAIQKALSFGQLTRMKIDNMREEHHERVIQEAEKLAAQEKRQKPQEKKRTGFIAVSIGEGMNEIFREIGVDYIIEGGQTMNPSTDDMLQAIDEVNAETIFILPNNKNIILAANQARDLTKDKKIVVIPTKTVPQGITAVISFSSDEDTAANEAAMTEAIQAVRTGQVTYAVRDTKIGDKEIHEGDIMGIGDEGILAVGTDISDTAKDLLANLVTEESELISIYYGEDISEEEAERFVTSVEETYPDLDVDAHCGGQPIYYYVMSVE